ncbi:MAG: hypothetical protein AVDCRST_MAG08-2281 [uncultured Acetobacteraceae bacterium]|jgi:hypothetical protein|uniref:Uncharacterized protein n=1 Tax=uncultured Acetobacteraceae bacterium TaxID=169975 RepID=A0A6J4IJF7_9PROT|nr:MAG: hypothetical protein AVDCRST_MAG08-2281 [uncultured Acetobacteraceae bacterium]
MSVTVPDTAADTSAESASVTRRPWPRLAFSLGGNVFELRGPTLFLRLARMEVYVHTAEVSDWWTLREPGCFEAAMGRIRVSASKATAAHEP